MKNEQAFRPNLKQGIFFPYLLQEQGLTAISYIYVNSELIFDIWLTEWTLGSSESVIE